jgi:transcriptional regulator with XRE-family HTH domain
MIIEIKELGKLLSQLKHGDKGRLAKELGIPQQSLSRYFQAQSHFNVTKKKFDHVAKIPDFVYEGILKFIEHGKVHP